MYNNVARRPLIIVIDEDDDIGSALGKSVVKGYQEVLKAATEFAIMRPEDADSNAMFVGLKMYRELKDEGLDPEILVVGGHPTNSLRAQDLIKRRVLEAIKDDNSSYELYIVSDGMDELLMAEVLRDVGPIAGVRRVVVEQSLGVEGSYILLARYVRKALNDPRYSRYFLGVPGALLLVFGVITMLGYLYLALKTIAALLGLFLVIKGFDLEDKTLAALKRAATEVRESGPFQLAGLGFLALTAALSSYYFYVLATSPAPLNVKVGQSISYPLTAIIVGIMVYIVIGSVLNKMSRRRFDLWHEAELLVVLLSLVVGFYSIGHAIATIPPPSSLYSVTASYIYSILIGSGFLTYVIVGAALASIIEIYRRARR